MRKFFALILCLCCHASSIAYAADSSVEAQIIELKQMVQELKGVVQNQQKEIAQLKAIQSTQLIAPASSVMPAVSPSADTYRVKPFGGMTPEIGAVADIVLALDNPKEDEEGADRVSVRELELVLGSAVDPYTRMDATLGISDFEELEIEEAYVTRYGLPLDMTARIGRFLPRVGKAIPVHRDALDTVDEPLVVEKYFGHHGYSKTGADLSRSIDLPWAVSHEATLGVLEGGNGEEGALFGETRRHPTLYGHLKNYLDINDLTGLELGASYLTGSRDDDSSFEVGVIGLDGTLIHRYGDRRHIKLQSEAFRVSRTESFYERTDADTGEIFYEDLDGAKNLWGTYVLLDWRFDPQWAAGARFDDVQLIETADDFANELQSERGYTGYLTFYQSEFARWRAQYTHSDMTDGTEDNRVYLQGTFAIGEHKHKIQ